MDYGKKTRRNDKKMILNNLKGILGVLKIPLDNTIIPNFMKIYYAGDEAYLHEFQDKNKKDYVSQDLQDLLTYLYFMSTWLYY